MPIDAQEQQAFEQLAIKIHDLEQRVSQLERDRDRLSDRVDNLAKDVPDGGPRHGFHERD